MKFECGICGYSFDSDKEKDPEFRAQLEFLDWCIEEMKRQGMGARWRCGECKAKGLTPSGMGA